SNDSPPNSIINHVRIREATFDAGSVSQIVIDRGGVLAQANGRARSLLGLTPRDLGRPLQDLEVSYRPIELRSSIDQVYTENRIVQVKGVEWSRDPKEKNYYDIELTPLHDTAAALIGVSITFTDVSALKRLEEELQHSNTELETAYGELQSTNEELETT